MQVPSWHENGGASAAAAHPVPPRMVPPYPIISGQVIFYYFFFFFLLNLPSCCPPAVLFKLSVCTQNAVVPASVHFADLACKLQPTFVPAISTRRSLGFLSSL